MSVSPHSPKGGGESPSISLLGWELRSALKNSKWPQPGVVLLPRQWAHPSLSDPFPSPLLRPVLPASSSSEINPAGFPAPRGGQAGQPDSGELRIPDRRPPRGPHPVRLQLFPLAQAAEEGLLLAAQRLPGGQEHRAPHVEPHPLAPAARPRRRRCLAGLHPHRSSQRLHPPGKAAGGGHVPRAGHAGSCSPRLPA